MSVVEALSRLSWRSRRQQIALELLEHRDVFFGVLEEMPVDVHGDVDRGPIHQVPGLNS